MQHLAIDLSGCDVRTILHCRYCGELGHQHDECPKPSTLRRPFDAATRGYVRS